MSLTAITGFCARAGARWGSNGVVLGEGELYVGRSSLDDQVARRTWASDPTAGFDTGEIDTEFEGAVGGGTGGVIWTVQGGATVPVGYSGVTYGSIVRVKVRCAVQSDGLEVAWSELLLQCYSGGNLVDEVALDEPCIATTLGTTGNDEMIVQLQSDLPGITAVRLIGKLRILGDDGVVPAENDVLAEAFLFCNNCVAN
jgi:hypothetical protein